MQDLEDKPWRSDEMKSLEEGVPRLMESDLKKAARNCKAKTGVGCDGKVSLDVEKETRGEVGAFLEKVEQWEMAATSLHNDVFLDFEKCHEQAARCAHAYDHSLVGSVASARGLEMATKVSN